MSTVTCHTDGCGNAGIPLEMDLRVFDDPWSDQPTGVITDVYCGVCGQPITDIADTAPS